MVEDTLRVQAWEVEPVAAQSRQFPNLVVPKTKVAHGSTDNPEAHVQRWRSEVDNHSLQYSESPRRSCR